MNILAFDTCFNACSVAAASGLGGTAPRITSLCETMQTGHAERLVPMIAAVMSNAGLDWDQIYRIGVTTGPGTFTGTRICVSAARALALAKKIPVFPISSLEVLALGIPQALRDPRTVVLAAVDARRDEVYAQSFGGADLRPLSPPAVLGLDSAARLGEAFPIVITGSGADRLAEEARKLGRSVVGTRSSVQPDIVNALQRIAEMEGISEPLRPLYLRPPDAKPQEGKSIPRAIARDGA